MLANILELLESISLIVFYNLSMAKTRKIVRAHFERKSSYNEEILSAYEHRLHYNNRTIIIVVKVKQ